MDKFVAIISEFNPFHNGHLYLVNQAKSLFPDHKIVAIMSGNFTQRGSIAIIDKSQRATHAIMNGIDIVIELPVPYATSSAELFAYGGVKLANSIKSCDALLFGSECGEINQLTSIARAKIDNNTIIEERLRDNLKQSICYPLALTEAIKSVIDPKDIPALKGSNNILAIEYISSLIKLNSDIKPYTIKRQGNEYNDISLDSTLVSATAIRQAAINSRSIQDYVPNCVAKSLCNSIQSDDLMFPFIVSHILRGNDYIRTIDDVSEGLENLIYKAALSSFTYQDLVDNIKSKRFALTRIKRVLVNILLGITHDIKYKCFDEELIFKVLAINSNNLNSLDCFKQLPLITKYADYKKCNSPYLINLNNHADAIYSQIAKQKCPTSMVIV